MAFLKRTWGSVTGPPATSTPAGQAPVLEKPKVEEVFYGLENVRTFPLLLSRAPR